MEKTKEHTLVKVELLVMGGTKKPLYFACPSEQAERDVINEVLNQLGEHSIIDEFHVERIGKVRVLE